MSEPSNAPVKPPGDKRGQAIASLILGIISIVLIWFPVVDIVAVILSIIGFILGMLSRKSSGRGMAIAGIVLAIISIVIFLIALIFLGAVLGIAASHANG